MKINHFIKTLKIKHYIKNIIIILPLLFSMNILKIDLWLNELVMIVSFCFISSAVYIMNDLIDIKEDKLHPVKSQRPIAHGDISQCTALTALVSLFILSSVLAYHINIICVIIVLTYFILNFLYSFKLKQFAIIDAACIAIGFILRIVAGCYAINVLPSPLVVLMTFFVSMFFTCMKRKLEMQLHTDLKDGRASIQELGLNTINQFILINAILSISFYFTYTLDSTTIQRAGTQYLYLTSIPFTLIMYRLFLLINTKEIYDDPMHYLEQDKILQVLFVVYIIVLLLVLQIIK